MPVSGEVIELNKAIESSPEVVNNDSYGKGWMIKVKMSKPCEIDNLLSAEQYKGIIG